MIDDVTLAVLHRLDRTNQLRCRERTLMFSQAFDTDVVTLRGPTSSDYFIRFPEIRLCDHVNSLAAVVTEEIVLATLCDIYNRPDRYPWVEKMRD
jgi:hypothetical protein